MSKHKSIKCGLLVCMVLCAVLLFAACNITNTSKATKLTIDSIGTVDSNSILNDLTSNIAEVVESSGTMAAEKEVWAIVKTNARTIGDIYAEQGNGVFTNFIYSDAGVAAAAEIVATNECVKRNIEKLGISAKYKYDYTIASAGFAIYTQYGMLDDIAALNDVAGVYLSEEYTICSTATDMESIMNETGILANESEYKGDGILVAILDTGLDYNHSAFQTVPEFTSFKQSDANAFIEKTGRGTYVNGKVAFAYDYADEDNSVFPTVDHGTHVAGIIAGKDDEITGVVPNAQLAIMKTFSDGSTSTSQVDVVAAVEDCMALGVDMCNLSLGAINGFSVEIAASRLFMKECYDQAEKLGVIVVAAAGNEYSTVLNNAYGGESPFALDIGLQGNPSSYESTLTVASINSFTTPCIMDSYGNKFEFVNAVNVATSTYYDFLSEFLGEEKTKTCEYVFIDGYGLEKDYENIDVEGKIAVVSRGGDANFEEKQYYAYKAGAIACIVYNNDHGYINMGTSALNIPMIMISANTGKILKNNEEKMLTFSTENEGFGCLMSDFSSWGITGDLALSIDITAPGGKIYSSTIGNTYKLYSGTSMATPNLVGVLASVKQYYREMFPELTDKQLRKIAFSVMMSTADIVTSQNTNPASVRKQGAGEVNLEKALSTEAYLSVTGSDKAKLALGTDAQKTGKYTLCFNLTNISAEAVTYSMKGIIMSNEIEMLFPDYTTTYMRTHDDAEITYSAVGGVVDNDIITVESGKTAQITVEIQLSEASMAYLNEYFPVGDYIEGWICFESDEFTELNIPFLAYYGDYAKPSVFDDTIYDDEKSVIQYESGLYADYHIGTVVPLGAFLFDAYPGYELPKTSKEYLSISRSSYTCNGLSEVRLGLLRNCATITLTLKDKYTGEVFYQDIQEMYPKSYYNLNAEAISYAILNTGITVDEYNLANNQELIFTIEAESEYSYTHGLNKKEVLEYEIFVDFESPNLLSAKTYTENDEHFLDIKVYDNFAMQAFIVSAYDSKTNTLRTITDGAIPVGSSVKNAEKLYTLNITNEYNALYEGEEIYVQLVDYALNVSGYLFGIKKSVDAMTDAYTDIESNVSVNSNASDFTIINGELRAYKGNDEIVEIPAGVTVLGNNVFNNNKTIKKVIIPEGVTKIKNNCFRDAENLAEVVIPSTLQELWTYAFSNTAITEMDLSHTALYGVQNYLFLDATKLVEVKFPSTLERFARYVFKGCISLEKMNLEDTIIFDLSVGTFENCVSLKSFTAPATLKYILGANFINCLSLEFADLSASKIEYLPVECFRYCSSLEKVVLPSTLTGFDAVAFHGCQKLTDINIEDTKLSFMGNGCFADCTSIAEITLPETMVSLSNAGVFAVCSSLKKVTFLGNITTLGTRTFSETRSLKTLVLPSSISKIDDYCFEMAGIEKLVIMSDKAPTIGAEAFSKIETVPTVFVKEGTLESYTSNSTWSGFKLSFVDMADYTMNDGTLTRYKGTQENVILPPIVTSVASGCFDGTAVKSINVNEGVLEIQAEAFKGATLLNTVNLPSSLTSIGSNAFVDTAIETINIDAMTPPTVLADTFTGLTKDCVINVSMYAESLYKADPVWSKFNIKAVSEFEIEGTVLVKYVGTSLDVVIPEGITVIGENAFSNSLIVKVTMPKTLIEIQNNAFAQCTSLITVDFNDCKLEKIGDKAFNNCSMIETLELPASLKIIGAYAFNSLVSLESILFQEGLETIDTYAFQGCKSLTEITLPEGLTAMGVGAFSSCALLKKVILPDSLTHIPDVAFNLCIQLADINFTETLESIGSGAFISTAFKEIDIPASVTSIGHSAFFSCTKVVKVTIRGNVSTLDSVFGRFFALEELNIYGDIGSIIGYDFVLSEKLDKVHFYGTVGTITNMAFVGTQIKEVVFHEYVDTIDEYAFNYNKNLERVHFEKGVGLITGSAFNTCEKITTWSVGENSGLVVDEYGVMYNSDMTYIYKQPHAWDYDGVYVMPDSVTDMADKAFSYEPHAIVNAFFTNTVFVTVSPWTVDRPLMKGVELSKNLKSIPDYAFFMYSGLESVNASDNEVENFVIGDNAFKGAYSLNELVFPKNTISIGEYAFYEAKALETVILPNALRTIGKQAFGACESLKSVYIPAGVGYFNFSMVFASCDNLMNIEVAEGSESFHIDNGVIYNKDMTILVYYSATLTDKVFVVPEGIVRISANAFRGNTNLETVVFPESLRSIGDKAFFDSKVTTYLFTSLTAPRLEGLFNINYDFYYANFVCYIEDLASEGVNLRMYCPIEGNYDNLIFRMYFAEIYPLSSDILRKYTNA